MFSSAGPFHRWNWVAGEGFDTKEGGAFPHNPITSMKGPRRGVLVNIFYYGECTVYVSALKSLKNGAKIMIEFDIFDYNNL